MKPQRIDAVASQPHYVDHLAPIWHALPPEARGTFWGATRPVQHYAQDMGIDAAVGQAYTSPVCLVAGARDLTHSLGSHTRAVFVEHGAGQQYQEWPQHPSYAGGDNRHNVALFLALNDRTAALDRARWPEAQIAVVGSPRLDYLCAVRGDQQQAPTDPAQESALVVAFCWHYAEALVPETRSAWPYWRQHVAALHRDGSYELLGHGHPRAMHEYARWYTKRGINWTPSFETVIRHADVVCFDNTSAGYEAAACGIPVVALNAPWWRKDVNHGLRFWNAIPGPQVDDPAKLTLAIDVVADTWSVWEQDRQHVVNQVYPPHTRGQAAALATAAVLELLG